MKDGADELVQCEQYRWRARTGWSITWGECRDLTLAIRWVGRRAAAVTRANGRSRPPRERWIRLTVDEYGGQEQAQFALSDWPWARRVS